MGLKILMTTPLFCSCRECHPCANPRKCPVPRNPSITHVWIPPPTVHPPACAIPNTVSGPRFRSRKKLVDCIFLSFYWEQMNKINKKSCQLCSILMFLSFVKRDSAVTWVLEFSFSAWPVFWTLNMYWDWFSRSLSTVRSTDNMKSCEKTKLNGFSKTATWWVLEINMFC